MAATTEEPRARCGSESRLLLQRGKPFRGERSHPLSTALVAHGFLERLAKPKVGKATERVGLIRVFELFLSEIAGDHEKRLDGAPVPEGGKGTGG